MIRIISRAIVKEFKPKHSSENQASFKEDYRKQGVSLDEFSDTLEQVDFQIRFLTALVYRLAQPSSLKSENSIRILRTPDEIADCLYKQDADCLMLTSPEHIPVVLKRKEIGWVKNAAEFADWLMVHWASEIMVIVVS